MGDSFKKIIVVAETIKPRRDKKEYLLIGLKDFYKHCENGENVLI